MKYSSVNWFASPVCLLEFPLQVFITLSEAIDSRVQSIDALLLPNDILGKKNQYVYIGDED